MSKGLQRIAALGAAGHFAEAEAACRALLRRQPGTGEARHYLGLALMQQGKLPEAVAELERAARLLPRHALVSTNLCIALMQSGEPARGVAAARRAAALAPDNPDVLYTLAHALEKGGAPDEAIATYRAVLLKAPGHLLGCNNLGNRLADAGRSDEALDCYRAALAVAPGDVRSRYNLGTLLLRLGRDAEAESELRALLALAPDHGDALNNLGAICDRADRDGEALALFRRATDAAPESADAWLNLGQHLDKMGQPAAAIAPLERAAGRRPDSARVLGALALARLKVCAWDGLGALQGRIRDLVRAGGEDPSGEGLSPYAALCLPLGEAEHLAVARRHGQRLTAAVPTPLPARPRGAGRPEVLRIGYLSADLREHPVAHLMAGVFALHDRQRFHVTAWSVGVDDGSPYRARIAAGCDAFHHLHAAPADAIARRIREDGTDILIDLTGYTAHGRTEVLAWRPAPVQVNYLGYPGTLGAPWVDAILADGAVIPPGAEAFYAERVVRLPHSYQANDRPPIADATPSRAACGLPEHGFVFCCFNATHKIEPMVFTVWMRLLAQVPGSVLWLFASHDAARQTLRRQAAARGIDPDRLVFAARLLKAEHLARHRLADLFLDTLSYGAHTTASDALWAGLPVLTLYGDSFARRVGASLLQAVGLPELITRSLPDYEGLALALARDPARLAGLRARLAANLPGCPLFDTPRFVRGLEAALDALWAASTPAAP